MKLLQSPILLLLSSWAPAIRAAAGCNADNCLRAIRGQNDVAASFCQSLTASAVTATAGLPTYVSQCTGQTLPRASSACSCFMATYTPPPKPTPTALKCNRDNCFRQLLKESSGAKEFCKTYTAKVVTETKDLPTIVSQCSGRPTAVSSACSCVMAEVGPTATPTAPPGCTPTFVLDGVTEDGFNNPNTPFIIKPSCNKLDTKSHAVFLHGTPDVGPFPELGTLLRDTTIAPDGITVSGFASGYKTITVAATDDHGNPIVNNFVLLFGSINMPVLVVDENSKPVAGVNVSADATAYPGITQYGVTDANGIVIFTNLPPTSIGLFAKAADNKIGFNGVAATSGTFTLRLLPFYPASGTTSFDVSNGTTGWVGGSNKEVPVTKRDTALAVDTNGQPSLQKAHAEPKVYPFTKTVYIKYRFITSEVPGGYFGTQFNDYYIVSIRSNMGDLATDSQSMNGLGLGAFDSSGGTGWLTLQMGVHPKTEWVQFDVGVSNVADSLYDSSVVVAKLGDLTCDTCGSCETCPGNPICQPTCQSPPPKSCDFYTRCAEEALECGAGGYPIRYGAKNCHRFQANLKDFSAQGQNWIWGTMTCLQKALIGPVGQCGATCKSVEDAAFKSHPQCYVDNGVCNLPLNDMVQLIITVNTDLFAGPALDQVLATAKGCASHYIAEIEARIDELKKLAEQAVVDAVVYYAKIVVLEGLKKYFQKYVPSLPQ